MEKARIEKDREGKDRERIEKARIEKDGEGKDRER